MNKIYLSLFAAISIGASTACGAVITTHTGTADPLTEGWFQEGGTSGVTTGPVNDTLPAWNVTQGGPSTAWYRYTFTPSQQSDVLLLGWHLLVTVRVNASGSEGAFHIGVEGSDGGNIYMQVDNGDLILNSRGALSNQYRLTGAAGDFITLELTGEPANGQVDLYADGVLRISDVTGIVSRPNPWWVGWGAGSGGGGSADYASVIFSSGYVPEPSGSSLMLIAAAWLLNRRAKRL